VSEALHLVAVVDSGVGDFESTDRLADVGRLPVIIADRFIIDRVHVSGPTGLDRRREPWP
jgi:hypothetical protein